MMILVGRRREKVLGFVVFDFCFLVIDFKWNQLSL
jgi:hypothetical protein